MKIFEIEGESNEVPFFLCMFFLPTTQSNQKKEVPRHAQQLTIVPNHDDNIPGNHNESNSCSRK